MLSAVVARRPKTPKWLQAARAQQQGPADWLSRALGRAGALPLNQAERAIQEGRVKIDGAVVKQPFTPVREGMRVTLDGREVDIARMTRVLMLHKPAGVVTAGIDQHGVGTVFDTLAAALPDALRGYQWHAVGRLDRDTTGLLLFTNDERFVQHATSPQTHLPKRYLATVSEKATEAQLQPLRDGIVLDDGPARPANARLFEPGLVELTLTEGKHHQVKRMLAAVGLPVLKLHRQAIGTLELDVAEGAVRELSRSEIAERLNF